MPVGRSAAPVPPVEAGADDASQPLDAGADAAGGGGALGAGIAPGAGDGAWAPAGAAGLAIGAVILCDIMMGGTQTGAAMNPARAFGPALASGITGTHLIYWAGPVLGAIAAALVAEYVHGGAAQAAQKKK